MGQNGFGATKKIVTLPVWQLPGKALFSLSLLIWLKSSVSEKNPVSWEIVVGRISGNCLTSQLSEVPIPVRVKERIWKTSKEDCVCACTLSHVQLFAKPWTIAHQTPLSVEFSRQEFWSRLSFPLGIQCSQGLWKALTWPWESREPQACTEIHILKKTWEDTHTSPLADLPGSGCQGKVGNLLLNGALKTCTTYRAESPSAEDMGLLG